MGRPLRCTHANRLAHVMFHTIDRFSFSPGDLNAFFHILHVLVKRHKMTLLCWTFMGNHIHLLFQFSEEVNCGTLVGTIESCLTKRFNARHGRKGPLWRGRYKDVTVDDLSQLWSVLFYILLNKPKAGILRSLEKDTYSSARVYLHGYDDGITSLPIDYLELGDTPPQRQRAFRAMLAEAWQRYRDKETWERIAKGERVTAGEGRIDMAQVMAMFQRQEDILERAMVRIRARSAVFSRASLQAMDKARARLLIERTRLIEALSHRKIPTWVVKLFFAEEDFICEFVTQHRSRFRYARSGPWPGPGR